MSRSSSTGDDLSLVILRLGRDGDLVGVAPAGVCPEPKDNERFGLRVAGFDTCKQAWDGWDGLVGRPRVWETVDEPAAAKVAMDVPQVQEQNRAAPTGESAWARWQGRQSGA